MNTYDVRCAMRVRVGAGAVLAAGTLVLLCPAGLALADPVPTDTNGSSQQEASSENPQGAAGKLTSNDSRETLRNLNENLQQRLASDIRRNSVIGGPSSTGRLRSITERFDRTSESYSLQDLRLQNQMDRVGKVESTVSSIMKKQSGITDQILRNLR